MANIPNISLPCVSWKSSFVQFDKQQSSHIFFGLCGVFIGVAWGIALLERDLVLLP